MVAGLHAEGLFIGQDIRVINSTSYPNNRWQRSRHYMDVGGGRVAMQFYIFKDQVIASDMIDAGITGYAEYYPKMNVALSRIPTMIITTGSTINGNAETLGSLEFLPTDGSGRF
jgi:hypothetical protein